MNRQTWEEQKKANKVEVSAQPIAYEDCVVKIEKATIEWSGDTKIKHPLLDSVDPGQGFLVLECVLSSNKYPQKQHTEIGGFFTKNGQVACYPTSKDGKIKGTLLYDVVHAAKAYSATQQDKLEAEDWMSKLPEILNGMKFKMRVKYIEKGQNEYTMLETSRQIAKDAEYAAKGSNNDDGLAEVFPDATIENSTELPF